MIRAVVFYISVFIPILNISAQSNQKIILKGTYTPDDSIQVVKSYLKAKLAVTQLNDAMNDIWNIDADPNERKLKRQESWNLDPRFEKWLGTSDNLGAVNRRINRINAKFNKTVTFKIIKENKGRCIGWISAWTLPFGKVNIRLCEDFFIYRTHLQEKIVIHEMGHEAGMLSHHRIHGCRSALRAAGALRKNKAIKSPENYAWLAMSYLGLGCRN